MKTDTSLAPDWGFIGMLKEPLQTRMPSGWADRPVPDGAADLRQGLRFTPDFPDPEGLLRTAWDDLSRFLELAGLADTGRGALPLRAVYDASLPHEAHVLEACPSGVTLRAGDTEGLRRAVFLLEDEIRRSGPFLKAGTQRRDPFILTRLSRCFWGPIKRPPMNRDELADNEDYYPDEYLNRLAHDGVNGVWITVSFRELLPSKVIPEFNGKGCERKLEKLRATVAKCRRYGIGVYAFCIEPDSIDEETAAAHPALKGIPIGGGRYTFCTGSGEGTAYLEEAFYTLFRLVPGLRGVIDITTGEKWTHCWSLRITDPDYKPCPVCGRMTPVESVKRNLTAMSAGVRKAAAEYAVAGLPAPELISWPYSQYNLWGHDLTVESAANTPEGVCFCANFESGGLGMQLGREREVNDYWLSYAGPSQLYTRIAGAVKSSGQRLFAKLQVGCSHETATAPFIPVPTMLVRKYRAMAGLGVSGVMQCWYFGNYPSVMTKAAGMLSFAPLPESEAAFLQRLAETEYGDAAPVVARAWELFADAYQNYPLNSFMGYYGPMHDGPVWPLWPSPVSRPLPPSWTFTRDIPGDRIGECFLASHTTEEILYLCEKLASGWRRGTDLLETALPGLDCRDARELLVAKALGLQFESGYDIMRFYSLRESLERQTPHEQRGTLRVMRDIAAREAALSRELALLCDRDPRLGFHSEAEGYRYTADELRRRADGVDAMLAGEFRTLEGRAEAGLPLFPEPAYRKTVRAAAMTGDPYDPASWEGIGQQGGLTLHESGLPVDGPAFSCARDAERLYIRVTGAADETAELLLEPKRLMVFPAYLVGNGTARFDYSYEMTPALTEDVGIGTRFLPDGSSVTAVGLAGLGREYDTRPLRFNLILSPRDARWVDLPDITERMCYTARNTDGFGLILL